MPTLGQKLKEAREARKVSIERAHQDTKIHLKVLNAFENERFDVLGSIYVKGFLKKYSEYLGLNPEEVIKEYQASYPQTTQVLLEPVKAQEESRPINIKPIIIGAAIVISILAIYFVSYKISVSLGQRPKEEKKQVALARPVRKPISNGARKGGIKEEKPAFPAIPKNQPLKLALTANDDVWLQIKSDGKIIFQNILPKGATKKIEAQKNIELWTGKAESLSLDLNGHPLGSPGSGIIKGLLITREGIKRR